MKDLAQTEGLASVMDLLSRLSRRSSLALFAAMALAVFSNGPLDAQPKPDSKTAQKAEKSTGDKNTGGLGNFGNSKEPVKIDAASLQVVDKEQKAIYTGDVVAIQGVNTLRCSELVIFYTQQKEGQNSGSQPTNGASQSANGAGSSLGGGTTAVKKLDCSGPVSIVSPTQTAVGDHGVFEADRDLMTLTGHVVLTDCENVQRGDKLVYNTKTGIANVTNNASGPSGRVQGVFTRAADDKDKKSADKAVAAAEPKQPGCKEKK